ncbi:MAG: hypothetical protein H6742_22075 [Alphaproteobacteria bacterium]|nr:hypothetical protein [Alphaproteobacteria bacterium]
MPVTATEAARHYSENQRIALQLVSDYEALRDELQSARAAVAEELAQAITALAQAYLPTLDATALARAEELTGFRGFSRRDPIAAMGREEKVLQRTIANVLADERYRRRQYLVGEHGELTRERAEAASLLEPWEAECARFEDLDGFLDLVEQRYDTPEFQLSFWQAEYWRSWSRGDAICEALGMDDFGDVVLPAYQQVAEKRRQWREQVAAVDARIDEVHGLVQRHDQSVARIPRLPEIYLAASQEMLGKHLEHADPALLAEWLGAAPDDSRPILLALRRMAGLTAKLDAFAELYGTGIKGMIDGLRDRSQKYGRKISKFQRSKFAHVDIPDRWLDRSFQAKARKYAQRQATIRTLIARMQRYDDYDRFDLGNAPELWWYEMTGKAPSGSLTPRLRRWYDTHPDQRPTWDRDRDRTAAQATALAAAARELDDVDYLS